MDLEIDLAPSVLVAAAVVGGNTRRCDSARDRRAGQGRVTQILPPYRLATAKDTGESNIRSSHSTKKKFLE